MQYAHVGRGMHEHRTWAIYAMGHYIYVMKVLRGHTFLHQSSRLPSGTNNRDEN